MAKGLLFAEEAATVPAAATCQTLRAGSVAAIVIGTRLTAKRIRFPSVGVTTFKAITCGYIDAFDDTAHG